MLQGEEQLRAAGGRVGHRVRAVRRCFRWRRHSFDTNGCEHRRCVCRQLRRHDLRHGSRRRVCGRIAARGGLCWRRRFTPFVRRWRGLHVAHPTDGRVIEASIIGRGLAESGPAHAERSNGNGEEADGGKRRPSCVRGKQRPPALERGQVGGRCRRIRERGEHCDDSGSQASATWGFVFCIVHCGDAEMSSVIKAIGPLRWRKKHAPAMNGVACPVNS